MGKTASSDRTAFAVIGVDTQRNKFLLDGTRHRMNLTTRWETLKALVAKWRRAPGVEMVRVGYERYGLQSDIQHFRLMMESEEERARSSSTSLWQTERRTFEPFHIEEIAWVLEGNQSKDARVGRLVPEPAGSSGRRGHTAKLDYRSRVCSIAASNDSTIL